MGLVRARASPANSRTVGPGQAVPRRPCVPVVPCTNPVQDQTENVIWAVATAPPHVEPTLVILLVVVVFCFSSLVVSKWPLGDVFSQV